ncbi:hypothetical protein IGI04_042262 [Brassica rapa subsp. trilocularis]|uniref:Uncharacterized protein n=1 Tax=Brassica rapa subsp. trilocularis TaxID=1813537 RepID=A0ABQ7KKE7_BRACM|nr:hypothetical protein IGI04_042262 [Brassica rapa subsp. trilocularis]
MEELGLDQVQEGLRRVFGQVCKLRDWPYGFGTDRTDPYGPRHLESSPVDHLTTFEVGAKIGQRARFIRTWFQLPLSSKLTPMPFPNQEEASWSFGCSTSSRRRCAHQWRPEAVLGRSPLSHGRPEERRPLEACPSHSHSLSKKKGESFQLVPGSQKVFLVHHQIRVERERMMPIVCTMEKCYKKGEAQMVVKLTGVLLLNIAKEGYSIKAASIVHKGSDTCNSPSTKNVETKVLCHYISSLGHSLVYRKCSMGHYAMRVVSCETLYGDSNTLIPVTSLCKDFYKDHQPDQVSGVSRQEAVQSSLGKYHCLSLTKDVPGHLLASLKRLFSKMAVKSVERGRLQTGFMKRAKSRRDLEEYLGKCANLGTGRTDLGRGKLLREEDKRRKLAPKTGWNRLAKSCVLTMYLV